MSKKNKPTQSKTNYPIGNQASKTEVKKETDFYTKHKSTVWTIILLIVLTFFFIMNNTRKIPAEGPYPPNYIQGNLENKALQ